MPDETALLATIAVGLAAAFVGGLTASRLGFSPVVGYLLAGVAVGPATPGVVADVEIAGQLAEIGVILLMFGVGLHFSFSDLLAVRRIAVPGALVRIAVATLLGTLIARAWGWTTGAGLIFGLALSVASTVVLLRALEERNALESTNGRIAVGWLVVEDLAMVLALVLIPALTPSLAAPDAASSEPTAASIASPLLAVGLTLGKVAVFVLLMLFVGTRAIPWLLERVARTGSRELFTLGVLAVALGIAFGAASMFGVSFALGAFFAGVVISESHLSHRAAADALPLQDAFAVLFFVSVGMLFDPAVLIREPLRVLEVVAIILLGKSAAALLIGLAFGYPLGSALFISAALAQIGEFSFILAELGTDLGLLPEEGRSLILAGALLSITVNPLAFRAAAGIQRWFQARRGLPPGSGPSADILAEKPAQRATTFRNHAVIVGHGRVGGTIGAGLARVGIPYVVIERDRGLVHELRGRGLTVVYGDAAAPGVLERAHVDQARLLIVTAPEPYQVRQILTIARRARPAIETVVRTHSDAEQRYLERHDGGRVVMGERELACSMTRYALESFGFTEQQAAPRPTPTETEASPPTKR
jgi:CPA2 family monovalent cation:H+ antiporter-2